MGVGRSKSAAKIAMATTFGVLAMFGSLVVASPAGAVGAATKIVLTAVNAYGNDTPLLLVGHPTTLTATIEDSTGKTVTTGTYSTAKITFAQTSGTGTVTGLGTFTAVKGVATDVITGATVGDDIVDLQASGTLSSGLTDSNTLDANYDAFHGIGMLKSCTSATLIGQAYTCKYLISNTEPTAHDTIIVSGLSDEVFASGGDVFSPGAPNVFLSSLYPALLSPTGSATCSGSSPNITCTLPYGSSLTAGALSFYTVEPGDYTIDPTHQLDDTATVYWNDVCEDGSGNCSTATTTETANSSTTVQQYTPSVTTKLTPPGPVVAGASVTDQATLTGTSPTAGGTVSYAVFSDDTCTTQVASLGTKTVTDGTVGPSSPWTAVGGSYWFQATYSGDASNAGPVSSACTSEPFSVEFAPSVTTALTPPGAVTAGESVSDQATLVTASLTAGGTVSYAVFSNATCTTQVASLGTETVTDGTVGPSSPWTAVGGSYWFQATYSGDSSDVGPVSSACSSEPLTVEFAPSVTTALTPPGPVTAGASVSDQATLTGASPTAGGTVSYAVFSNDTCTTQVATLGTKTVTDGSVGPSNAWTSVGGSYWFQATYSGDSSDVGPVSSACSSEPLTVQVTPSVTTALTPPGPVVVGASVSDQATLTGASATAGGTVSYAVFSNDTCTTQVATLGTKTVTDGTVGPSSPWTAVAGTYWFQATYSGDALDVGPVSSACSSEPLTVQVTPSVTTALTPPGPVTVGASVTDQATLTGASATAGGTVSYAVFSNNTCTTQVATLGTKTVTDGIVGPSNEWTAVAGSYWFQATYSGDALDVGPVSSACSSEPLTVQVTPSVTTALTPPGPVVVGASVGDQATLTGASPTAGGTVSYAVFSNDTCTTQVASLGTKTVTDGTVGPSSAWTAVAGTYWFQATYSGDALDVGPVSSACSSEPLTVQVTPSVTTALTPPGPVTVGASVSDQATITGASATAGGTVSYAVFSNNTCTTQVATLGTKTVTDGTVGPSNAWTAVAGSYWFQATYSGDALDVGPVSSACSSEPITVQVTPSVTTALTPPGPVVVGASVSDQATLTGASATAGGTVSYAVYSNATCTTQVATLGTKTVTDGTVGPSSPWTSLAGTYWFQATYSGDALDVGPVSSACSSEPITVQVTPSVTTKLTPPGPVTVGASVSDQATLTGASATAGGTVSYAVYSNATCTTQVASLGTKTVTDGSVGPSSPWTSVFGTYWFQATYSGDALDVGPVSSACSSEPITVQTVVSVTTQLTPPGPVVAGTSVTDQATLTGASPTAGGTASYAVFSNNTCTTQVAALGTKTVTDGTVGPSNAWTAIAGSYWFQATYSGDALDVGPISSTCSSEPITVQFTPSVTTKLTPPGPVAAGTSVTDQATLTGASPTAGGTVSYAVFSNDTCTTQVASLGTKTVTDGTVGPSSAWTAVVGSYWFQATYSGDALDVGPVSSACTSEPLTVGTVSTHLTETASASTVASGTSVTFTYTETNTGLDAIMDVTVTGSSCGAATLVSSSDGNTTILEPGAVWTFTCKETLTNTGKKTITVTDKATATGTDVLTGKTAPPETASVKVKVTVPVCGIAVTVSPNPLVETGDSDVRAVVQVEACASYAGDLVNIDSSQLTNSCTSVAFGTLQPGVHPPANSIQVVLDDDGNATVTLTGTDCTPGPSLVEADLVSAPYLTATTTLTVLPPNVTPAGVVGYPANEVETGDTPASGTSDVYAVFYVETDPVYAEATVEISSAQLASRCLGGVTWTSNLGTSTGSTATATIDNDGNAVFTFTGASCAPGTSTVIADILAGAHTTYSSNYTIDPPTVTPS